MLNKFSRFILVLLALSLVVSVAYAQDDEEAEYTIATVVKLTGIAWFDRMEVGVQQFDEDFENVTAFQQGPSQADAALQVQVIEDILAQGVDALCVIPFQPESVEPVLERARDEGVVVITHEASNQENIDFDIEAFDNSAYGEHLMENLAQMMGGEGQYAVFVGSLTSRTHNEWVDAAIAYQEENYPDMELVGDKNESFDDAQVAYERMQELLIAYPDLKGVQGSASTDVIGVGQAVEEAGLEDVIHVVGTGLPGENRELLESGAVDLVSFWDPALAGYACNMIALQMLEGTLPEELFEGELPEDGFGLESPNEDFPLTGYEEITIGEDELSRVLFGAAWVDVTAENVDEWEF
ncbi:MAG: autoinducer 2 ABC transporter substrate-binding protein [Anaerolineae bacterium]